MEIPKDFHKLSARACVIMWDPHKFYGNSHRFSGNSMGVACKTTVSPFPTPYLKTRFATEKTAAQPRSWTQPCKSFFKLLFKIVFFKVLFKLPFQAALQLALQVAFQIAFLSKCLRLCDGNGREAINVTQHGKTRLKLQKIKSEFS